MKVHKVTPVVMEKKEIEVITVETEKWVNPVEVEKLDPMVMVEDQVKQDLKEFKVYQDTQDHLDVQENLATVAKSDLQV